MKYSCPRVVHTNSFAFSTVPFSYHAPVLLHHHGRATILGQGQARKGNTDCAFPR